MTEILAFFFLNKVYLHIKGCCPIEELPRTHTAFSVKVWAGSWKRAHLKVPIIFWLEWGTYACILKLQNLPVYVLTKDSCNQYNKKRNIAEFMISQGTWTAEHLLCKKHFLCNANSSEQKVSLFPQWKILLWTPSTGR